MAMILRICEIQDENLKGQIAREILDDLPEWFGVEGTCKNYIEKGRALPFFALNFNGEYIGYLSLKINSKSTGEILSMGIKKKYHNKGFGKKLIQKVENVLKQKKFRLLLVKTLSKNHPDKYYALTHIFYEQCGFLEVDEVEEIWGKENPCVIMVKIL